MERIEINTNGIDRYPAYEMDGYTSICDTPFKDRILDLHHGLIHGYVKIDSLEWFEMEGLIRMAYGFPSLKDFDPFPSLKKGSRERTKKAKQYLIQAYWLD